MKKQDEYMEPVTYVKGNFVVNVYRPILTDEERARRMKRIHDSAAALLRDVYKHKGGEAHAQ